MGHAQHCKIGHVPGAGNRVFLEVQGGSLGHRPTRLDDARLTDVVGEQRVQFPTHRRHSGRWRIPCRLWRGVVVAAGGNDQEHRK